MGTSALPLHIHTHSNTHSVHIARAARCSARIICLQLRQESARPSALLPALSALSRITFAPLFHFTRVGRLSLFYFTPLPPPLSLSLASLPAVRVSFSRVRAPLSPPFGRPSRIALSRSHAICRSICSFSSPLFLSLFCILRALRLWNNLSDEVGNTPSACASAAVCGKIARRTLLEIHPSD